jgi:hypothetical protein
VALEIDLAHDLSAAPVAVVVGAHVGAQADLVAVALGVDQAVEADVAAAVVVDLVRGVVETEAGRVGAAAVAIRALIEAARIRREDLVEHRASPLGHLEEPGFSDRSRPDRGEVLVEDGV